MAAEQSARADTGVPDSVRHSAVHEESREEKTRENEASRPDSQVVKNHCIPFEGN